MAVIELIFSTFFVGNSSTKRYKNLTKEFNR